MAYAEGTDVPVERSKAEIEKVLTRYNASKIASMWDRDEGLASIAFEAHSRRVRFSLSFPDLEDFAKTEGPNGRRRNPAQQKAAQEGETRRRWRALALVIKAKLEAVTSGVSTFEEEFLAHIVLPSGDTVGTWLAPQIADAYQTKKMPPPLLLEGKR